MCYVCDLYRKLLRKASIENVTLNVRAVARAVRVRVPSQRGLSVRRSNPLRRPARNANRNPVIGRRALVGTAIVACDGNVDRAGTYSRCCDGRIEWYVSPAILYGSDA